MAPEAFSRKRNEQTDLWSVGVMLYQILAGLLPFVGQDMAEIMGAIINEEPEPLPASVPAWLRQVITKALKKNPALRYQTAAEMRAALTPRQSSAKETPVPQPYKREPPVSKPPPRPQPAPPKPRPQPAPLKNLRRAVKRGVGLAIVVVALVTYLATRTPSPTSSGFSDSPGATQSQQPTRAALIENLNGVKLEMMRVPGGEFLMGSPPNEEGRDDDEGPQHRVTVPSFYIGKYEVTQAQWKAVMGSGNNPSNFKGDDLPVGAVSWNDAKDFCRKLSGMTGKLYRLPSEAEWEYACRARTTGANAGNLDAIAWYRDNSGGMTHPVGLKQANAFGLFDIHSVRRPLQGSAKPSQLQYRFARCVICENSVALCPFALSRYTLARRKDDEHHD
jgi:formylglycine-generating enzyme required for sulfatase activity